VPAESKWFLLLPAIFGVALLSLGHWLWQREHYQFFPFVLAGVAVLAYFRLDGVKWKVSKQLNLHVLVFGLISAVLFGMSVWTSSPWLGSLSAMAFAWMLVWMIGGEDVARELRGPFAVLFLILPLPLDLDRTLIFELQLIASWGASTLLDYFTIVHTNHGVSISTISQDFMVEEACSGIHSLFSCLTVMMFWAVFQRYGLIRAFLTLLHTIVWVVVANAFRVFALVYADTKWNVDLTEGWRHELLGVATYCLAIGLALSMDQLLRFVVRVRETTPGDAIANNSKWRGEIRRFFNRPVLSEKISGWVLKGALGIVFVPLAVASLVQAVLPRSASATNSTITEPEAFAGMLNVEQFRPFFPPSIMGYELESVESVNRESGDAFGSHSLIGTYVGNGQTVRFSVDGFYDDWHDLAICYRGLGWQIQQTENRAAADDLGGDTNLLLFRDGDQQSYCIFSCHEKDGDYVRPGFSGDTAFRSFIRRLTRTSGMFVDDRDDVVPPVLQFQLYAFSDVELLDEELRRLDRLFRNLRTSVAQGISPKDAQAESEDEGGQGKQVVQGNEGGQS
jgi:exosortase